MSRKSIKSRICGNGAVCEALFLLVFLAIAINLPMFNDSEENAYALPYEKALYDTPDQGYGNPINLDKNDQTEGSGDYYEGGEFDTGYKNDPSGEVEYLIEELNDLQGFNFDI